uniref:Uncharacterized protein n=1 Tax=Coniferiporia sulphurascens TaxID=175648 RepID=A0A5B9RKG8_CONSH|nr:hypothetical protein PSUO_000051 [Coniferiporia sulphurascens]QEG57157.1 hypothetical protein PSUO_000051 [Coniferiporia sulphurascens]
MVWEDDATGGIGRSSISLFIESEVIDCSAILCWFSILSKFSCVGINLGSSCGSTIPRLPFLFSKGGYSSFNCLLNSWNSGLSWMFWSSISLFKFSCGRGILSGLGVLVALTIGSTSVTTFSGEASVTTIVGTVSVVGGKGEILSSRTNRSRRSSRSTISITSSRSSSSTSCRCNIFLYNRYWST